MGEYEDSIKWFNLALNINPQDNFTLCGKGIFDKVILFRGCLKKAALICWFYRIVWQGFNKLPKKCNCIAWQRLNSVFYYIGEALRRMH